MNILLYGEDNFSAKKYLEALVKRYLSKEGGTNLKIYEGKDLNIPDFQREIDCVPFLAPHRLFVIKNYLSDVPLAEHKIMLEIIQNIPSTSVLIFYESEIFNAKSPLFKELQCQASRYFPKITVKRALSFINQKVSQNGLKIEEEASQLLIERLGFNLDHLNQELDKLILLAKAQKQDIITKATVVSLVQEQVETKVFNLLNNLTKAKDVFKEYHKLKDTLDELYLWNMLIYQVRLLILAKINALQTLKVHPFQQRMAQELASFWTMPSLKNLYQRFLLYDYGLKTGKIDKRTALELILGQIARREDQTQN